MCIAILSNAHPDYMLIVASNRDEYLDRPTQPAHWWDSPNQHVLGGRDLLRVEQGTWLALTRDGRLAILTNVHDAGPVNLSPQSRGLMINAFLSDANEPEETDGLVDRLVRNNALDQMGGFSLVCGRMGQPLAVVSNRAIDVRSKSWILENEHDTVAISNALLGDRSWPKVVEAELLMAKSLKWHQEANRSQEDLVGKLFEVLSHDTLPKSDDHVDWNVRVESLRNSIFIAPIEHRDGSYEESPKPAACQLYGTQRQTVILVDNHGNAIFVERSRGQAWNKDGRDDVGERRFSFLISPHV